MRKTIGITLLFYITLLQSQPLPFSENGKWGFRTDDRVIVPAVYDTVFGFDPTGKVCLACHRVTAITTSGFIRVKTTSHQCNYLDGGNRRLVAQNMMGDTTSVFSLGRHAVRQYSHTGEVMTVSSGGVRHLFHKDFHQLTFKGYYNVEPLAGADFYKCEYRSESEAIFTGVITRDEKQLVPFNYSDISINPNDSLIIGCSAGFKGTDDVFDYSGKKLLSSARHIMFATRALLVEKHPETPRRYYIVDRRNKKEILLEADEVTIADDEIRFRKKKNWYRLDPRSGEKEVLKQL